ncbi:MAG TPA: hypothetical protein DEA89_02510 [Candidatus Moranbacteria bacterium]|nr:hypothetical protein [Candidatus Moranbacteria bacterium]HBI50809.1 hypothetical protein [Candidatus Moranbacteria bacterium]HBU10769.1 hypothetical protein [Candidatus Moranbacteria bacterium]HCO99840.1 hypothetical protein [Candidatus Moranbacteria bacterium]
MMNIIKQLWHSFKERPDIWFFYIFLATFTLSIRKVLYFHPINNSFNEYTGVYIYLSDLFLILTFLLYILYNNKSILSNITSFLKNHYTKFKLFHACLSGRQVEQFKWQDWSGHKKTLKNVPRGTFTLFKKTYALLINNYLVIFPLFIAFFSFVSILWTTNRPVAIFRSIKLTEFIFLYFYIISIVPRGTILQTTNTTIKKLKQMFHVEHFEKNILVEKSNCSTWNNFTNNPEVNVPRGTFIRNVFLIIIITGLIQATIGIIQFIFQKSLGLFWLKESIISSSISGVAKIILNGEAYIRVYGLFPHPNIFGGFLVFSILISFLYLKMFHVEHFYWGGTIWKIFISIQFIALSLTFSKSAIIGLLMGLFYLYTILKINNVPRGTLFEKYKNTKCSTWNISIRVKHFKRNILITFIAIMLFVIIAKLDLNSLLIKSLGERLFYLGASYEMFLSHPFIGVGAGQLVFNLMEIPNIQVWQFQPVHNVFLLILNEFGIFILSGFLYFIFKLSKLIKNVPRGTITILSIFVNAILVAFIFIMLFDHYFWDIQQGQILLWMTFGLIASQNKRVNPDQLIV